MNNFIRTETKYKFQPYGKYYYETEIKPIVEDYGFELVHLFFIDFFNKVKDEHVKQCLKDLENSLFDAVYNFLDNTQHYAIKTVSDNRKIKKIDQTYLLTIGLYPQFKHELYKVLEANSGGLYEVEETV